MLMHARPAAKHTTHALQGRAGSKQSGTDLCVQQWLQGLSHVFHPQLLGLLGLAVWCPPLLRV